MIFYYHADKCQKPIESILDIIYLDNTRRVICVGTLYVWPTNRSNVDDLTNKKVNHKKER
jgi:hypothetical protein